MADENLKERIKTLINKLAEGLFEREEHMAVALLAALAGLNIFLLGPPGTAKSLLARRLKEAFEDGKNSDDGKNSEKYFEYLMQKFSTPDELFGPVSISELKKDNYVRKTEGFLPTAHFAFLDEIWKSSSAILNTLLTLINEKKFRNGVTIQNVPLKALIAASNETPPSNQGLEALYDRFIVRLYVPPMEKRENFESLIQNTAIKTDINCGELIIKEEELTNWRKEIHDVKLSEETRHIICAIRLELEKEAELDSDNERQLVYVSDRRWQQAAILLKAGAFFCGRTETNLSDTLLLRHCLWTDVENRESIMEIVENTVEKSGFTTNLLANEIIEKKNNTRRHYLQETRYSENEYGIIDFNNKECYEYLFHIRKHHSQEGENFKIYIPISKNHPSNEFNPMSEDSKEDGHFTCQHVKGEFFSVCARNHTSLFHWNGSEWEEKEKLDISPTIKHKKGAKKRIKKETKRALIEKCWLNDVYKCEKEFKNIIKKIESQIKEFEITMDSPFILCEKQNIALRGVKQQLDDIQVQYKDCKRLEAELEKEQEELGE